MNTTPLPDERVQLLKWLAYNKVVPVTTISDWHVFTRRVCFYHSSGSKDHESLLVPTMGALGYHMLRSEYVLKTVFAFATNTTIDACQYGWRVDNSIITVIWDDEDTMKAVVASKGCGCRGAKCDGSTSGCSNCYRMCKACNSRCRCKGNCRNPHNNGTCPRCEQQNESDDETDDEEQTHEVLPLVPRSADLIDSSTDSDDDAGDI